MDPLVNGIYYISIEIKLMSGLRILVIKCNNGDGMYKKQDVSCCEWSLNYPGTPSTVSVSRGTIQFPVPPRVTSCLVSVSGVGPPMSRHCVIGRKRLEDYSQ